MKRMCVVFACMLWAIAGVTGCPDMTVVAEVEVLATQLSTLLVGLPTHNFSDPAVITAYNGLVESLCTTHKGHLENLTIIGASCAANLALSTTLQSLTFLGKNLLQLYSNFADVDQFCDCRAHLVSAWIVAELQPSLLQAVSGGAYTSVGNLPAYCNNPLNLTGVINDLNTGQATCSPLYLEAELNQTELISDIKSFLDNECVSPDQTGYDCTLTQSTSADLITCINNPSNATSSGNAQCSNVCCGVRACIDEHMPTCSATGRTLYAYAVNLARTQATYVASQTSCTTSGATVALTSAVTTLGIYILLFAVVL